MTVKQQLQRVWEKDGWELWMKQQGGYVELCIKRPQKDYRMHSSRIGEHGIQLRFKKPIHRD